MLLTDAKIYVAKILGGQNDTNMLALALDGINATYQNWLNDNNWEFLLEDNEGGFQVASCILTSGNAAVPAPTTTAFYGVNPGITVTGTNIPAGTTVSSVSGDTYGGGITSITLSAAPTGSGATTLTFGGYIPIVVGQDMYNLPPDFSAMLTVQLLTNPRELIYLKARERDRKLVNQTQTGTPTHYTIYKKHDFTAGAPHSHMRVTVIPSAADSARIRYYRAFNTTATSIDMPDNYLYVFLDDAQCWFLRKKNAGDPRLPGMEGSVAQRYAALKEVDMNPTDDEEIRIISQMEVGPARTVNFNIWDSVD